MPSARPGSTCRDCTCGPSTRSCGLATAYAPAWSPRRLTAGSRIIPDPATAALVRHRAAYYRAIDAPATGLPLIEEALRLFEQAPPSADHAEALLDYARTFLVPSAERHDATRPALDRALEIAEAAGATALIPRVLAGLADDAFFRGQVEEGFAFLQRGWALAQASEDGPALAWLAVIESDALFRLAQFQRATRGGLARPWGCPASGPGDLVRGDNPGCERFRGFARRRAHG